MEYTIKKYRFSPVNGQWELIREITLDPILIEHVLKMPRQDIPAFWKYHVFDDTGKQVASIESVNPNLFD